MDRDIDFLGSDMDMDDIQFENIDSLQIRSRNGFDSPSLTSDPSYNINSSSLSYGVLGRNKNRFTVLLERFTTKAKKPPKREYFNAFIIRAIKRGFRNIISNKLPSTTCIKINLKNPLEARYWNELGNLYRGNIEEVTKLASTESGPKTDGKKRGSRAKNGESERAHKSFNNKFCQDFFTSSTSQQAFKIIVELIFSEFIEGLLSEKFKFQCCNSKEHNSGCMNKWNELKDYLLTYYFRDLDVPIAESLPEIDSVFSSDINF